MFENLDPQEFLKKFVKKFLSLFLIGTTLIDNINSHAMLSKDLVESASSNFIDEVKHDIIGIPTTENQIFSDGVKELKETVEASDNAMLKQTYSDKNYVIKALNIVDPFIYYITGITENFRFFDASKMQITQKNLKWIFSDDKGQGSANFMKLLFPSPAGVINVGTGANRKCFTSNCNPTSELIADIACYFHNCVRNTEQSVCDIAQAELTSLIKKNKNQIRTIILQTEAKNILERCKVVVTKGNLQIGGNISVDDQNRIVTLFNTLNSNGVNKIKNVTELTSENTEIILRQLFENVKNGAIKSFPLEHFITFGKDQKYSVDAESFKTVLELLNEGAYMITHQEFDGADDSKILPKYTTEKMLMAYFLLYKNDQSDIDNFYNHVKTQLKGTIDDGTSTEEVIDKFSKRLKILEDLKVNENSPYKSSVLENGNTCSISSVDRSGNVTFKADTFQDCADTAVRHVVNLLTYDKENKWNKLLCEVDRSKLKKNLDGTLQAIKNRGTVPFRTLKERLQMFFFHQEQESVGADAVDKTTRSLWNYVISNMDKNVETGLYPIIYVEHKNFELKSGFENSLKLLYNIAYSLKLSNQESLQEAKSSIDHLENISNGNDRLKLIRAINAVYQLFNKNAIADTQNSNVKVKDNRWLGSVEINCAEGNSFVVDQMFGHSRILFDPVLKYSSEWLEQNIGVAEQDEILAILVFLNSKNSYKSQNNNYRKQLLSKYSLFSKLYVKDPYLETYNSIVIRAYSEGIKKYVHSYAALRFMKGLQGEQDNDLRICMMGQNLYCCGTFNFGNLRFKIKNGKHKEDSGPFLINNYLIKAHALNPEECSWGKTLYKLDPCKFVQTNGIDYYCKTENNSVILYPILPSHAILNKKITIPASVKLENKNYKISGIGASAFSFSPVEEIEFENGIENLNLDYYSFSNCSKLKKVIIPDSVKTLSLDRAFFGCSKLESFKLPETLEVLNLGTRAFGMCPSMKKFPIPQSIKNLKIGDHVFDLSSVENLVIPQSVEILDIENYAFGENKSFKNLILQEGLKCLNIEQFAFSNSSLDSFLIPKSVKKLKIENCIFNDCENLKNLIIPKLEGEGIDISDDVLELYRNLQHK